MNATLRLFALGFGCVLAATLDLSAQTAPPPAPSEAGRSAALPLLSTDEEGIDADGGPGRGEGERERDEIETDRDSFTPATTTAGLRRLIVESAYSFIENRGVAATHSFPELLLRYGVLERFELRLGWNYEVGGAGTDITGADSGAEELPLERRLERESNLAYGFKWQAVRQKEWVPDSTFIVQGFTPTSGQATNTQVIGTYVFGWELPRRWKLDAAFRYGTGTEQEDHFNEWAPSVVLKVPVLERVAVHAEYFGIFSTGKAEEFNHQYFSPGIHYLLTRDLEVGVRVGWGLNDQTPRFFFNVGLGWRF